MTMNRDKFYSLSDSYVTFTYDSPNNDDYHNIHGGQKSSDKNSDNNLAKGLQSLQINQNKIINYYSFHTSTEYHRKNNSYSNIRNASQEDNHLNWWLLTKSASDSKNSKNENDIETENTIIENLNSESQSVKPKSLSLPHIQKESKDVAASEFKIALKSKELPLKLCKNNLATGSNSQTGSISDHKLKIKWNDVEYWNFCSPNNTTDDDEENSNSDNSSSTNRYTDLRKTSINKTDKIKLRRFSPTKFPRLSQKGKRVDNKILRNLFNNYFKSGVNTCTSQIHAHSHSANITPSIPSLSAPVNALSVNNQNIDINGDSINYDYDCLNKADTQGSRNSPSKILIPATENGNAKSCGNEHEPCESKPKKFNLPNHWSEDEQESTISELSVRQREALMGRRRGILRTMSENSEFHSALNELDEEDEDVKNKEFRINAKNLNKHCGPGTNQHKQSLANKLSYEYNFEKKLRKDSFDSETISIVPNNQSQNKNQDNQTTPVIHSEILTMDEQNQTASNSGSNISVKSEGVKTVLPTSRASSRTRSARVSISSDDDKHYHVRDDDTSSSYSTAEEDHQESDIDPVTSRYTTPVGSLSRLSGSRMSLASNHSQSHGQSRSYVKRSSSNTYGSKPNINIELKRTRSQSDHDTDNDNENVDILNLSDSKASPNTNPISNARDKDANLTKQTRNTVKSDSYSNSDSNPNQSTVSAASEKHERENSNRSIGGCASKPVENPKTQVLLMDIPTITVKDLQAVFDRFKGDEVSSFNCDALLDSLTTAQSREDFQWALHQLGGFNALLFLYARVVEICPDDEIQSKSLSLVLVQLRHHFRLTDGPAHRQYHLIRFVLNSERSCFGFKTFIQVMNFCLSASGLKLVDYQLLDNCILSSWQNLTRVRCTASDAPTGPKTLLECLLTIVLDLLEERNQHRDFNVALLKANRFTETLLAICYNLVVDTNVSLDLMDAVRLASLVKSILAEIMAPPDAYVAVTLVKYGLCPLLPKELPPLPRKEDAFFIVQNPRTSSSSLFHNLRNIREAEEANEGDRIATTLNPSDDDDHEDNTSGSESTFRHREGGGLVPGQESESEKLKKENNEREFTIEKDDVPEIIGVQSSNPGLNHNRTISPEVGESQANTFSETFQENLLESVMSILLNALAIIPDGAFNSVLNPHISAHLIVSYCSHPSVQLKKLALKLLSAYLTRVKNPVVVDFLKCKGFYLTSLYIQGTPEVSQLALSICFGFGPLSYPLIISLLYSNTVVNKVIEWVQDDEAGKIPALMSMGLLPSIFNVQASSTNSLRKPLQNLLTIVTRFCALHAKDDPWKILFCPALESSYGRTLLISRILQEATEALRRNTRKELKKSDSTTRLMWLIERGTGSRLGHHFDKWLLNIFTLHIMEMDEQEETENWIFFVKKNRKKLNHLMGIFLCRVFAANRDNMDFKHYTVRVLLSFCPNLNTWLPKVLKHDEQVERCFTAFVRIFLSFAEQKCVKLDSHLRTPSFHSLISDNGNITLTLQMANALPTLKGSSRSRNRSSASENGDGGRNSAFSSTSNIENYHFEGHPGEIQLSDKVLRSKFENVLVDAGILSPTSNYSMFTPDFRNFKLLLGSSTSGVSPIELRQCIAMVEKMRAPISLSSQRLNSGVHGGTQNVAGNTGGKHIASTESYFEGIFEQVNQYAMDMLINVARSRTQQEVEVARRISVQDEDVATLKQWINVMEQMLHPKAPWHFTESYSSFSALDQSEGPGRVRIRLKREHLRVHNRFVMPSYRKLEPGTPAQPLDYLFASHSAELLKHPYILNEIHYMRFCTRIIPGEELLGEIILTQDHLTFIAEQAHFQSENVEVRKSCIKNLLKRRYTLEDRAVEIFLECRSFLFVFKNKKDRDEFVTALAIKNGSHDDSNCLSVNSTLLETSVTSMTSQWLKGQLSNFEYLMYLNTAAGRTYCDLMQYPVFPFVLSKYDSPTLDLLAPQSYRDLKKPMAIQDPSKEEHFISTYNYLKRECETAPFHYGSHYSNSGIVLHFLVRLPPYTQHFLKYQDGSFDIPDRSFHSVETTWRLASKESNTDFKEAIPEFFYLPEFLQNLQHFDLGVRQNGMRVDDVILPPWAKGDARIFTLVNRQALESNHVRKFLCDWIDLIFGYKQEGKAALQAVNVFHPSTYEGFQVDGNGDELLIKARKAMVSTYGQTPKPLFTYPHPRANTLPEEKCDMEVLDTVWGIRWGNFIGSPACPDLEVIHTREYTESVKLFETKSRVVFWPENTLILGDAVVGYWDSNSIRIKSTNVFFSIGDDITCCVGTTTSVWVGHQSGRISVLKLSPKMDKVMEKVELVGHYEPVRRIDVNLPFSTAISCSGENYAILWDINKYPKVAFNNAIECPDPVDDIYSSRSTGDVVLLSRQSNRVTLATINGAIVGSVAHDECIESACLSAMDPGKNVNVIAVGGDNGIIRFYSTYDMKFLNQLKVLPLNNLSIKSIRYSKDGRRLYCMSQTEEKAFTVALQIS